MKGDDAALCWMLPCFPQGAHPSLPLIESGFQVYNFFRAHGLGNDYLVMDGSPAFWTPARIAYLCDRRRGVGADGLLLRLPSSLADARIAIFNADGSRAEKSGNGLRIFIRALLEKGIIDHDCTIETDVGTIRGRVLKRTTNAVHIEVNMGRPNFQAAQAPMVWNQEEAIQIPLEIETGIYRGTCVSMGNPHFVVFTEDIEHFPIKRIGPHIEHHPFFPKRVNVQSAQVESKALVKVRIWERGVGWTESSGSSACAVVAAGQKLGLLGEEVGVDMPGGCLKVRRDQAGHLHQAGPVEMISTGTLAPDLLHCLQSLSTE